jgi:HEAT repeat protein/beta-lactamase regulating signal transducer with metallopeptidase domain
MNRFALSVASFVFVKTTLVLAAAFVAAWLLRHRSAAARSAVWTAALALLAVLPFASPLVPHWRPLGAAEPVVITEFAAVPAPAPVVVNASPDMAHAGHAPVAAPMALDSAPSAHPAARAALGVWLAGAAVLLLLLGVGIVRARLTARRAVPADERISAVAFDIATGLGITRGVRIGLARGLGIPVQLGAVRPWVILPAEAEDWPLERVRVVLLHELAHVARWDYAAHMLAQLARAALWINPLAWLAVRAAHAEQERATDDVVLRGGTRSADYAEHLLAIARSFVERDTKLSGALAMAHPAGVATRIRAILARNAERAPLHRRALLVTAVVTAVVGVPLASLTLLGESRDALIEREGLRLLRSDDPAERQRAAWLLGDVAAAGAADSLAARLHDADARVRGMAAWALGAVGGSGARRALEGALRDSAPYVREMAVLALGTLKDERAVPALAYMVNDTFPGVRSVLTAALHDIGGDAAGEVLATILTRDGDLHTRDMAAWNLRLTGSRAAREGLVRALADTAPQIRAVAAYNLGELGDRAAAAALARLLTDTEPRVRAAAAHALGALKDQTYATALAAAMADSVWHVRVSVGQALGEMGGAAALDALLAATRDPVHQVRLTAVESLNRIRQR